MTGINDIRLDNIEQTVERHERLIEQLVQSQMDMKTGLTKVATELEITNGLIGSYMASNSGRCYGSFYSDVITWMQMTGTDGVLTLLFVCKMLKSHS